MLAVIVLGPAVEPSVQVPGDATPLALVVAVVEPTVPPPATVNVTWTPASAAPLTLCTTTEGLVGTAVPAMAAWLWPFWMTMTPSFAAVAVKTTGATDVPGKLAVSVLGPLAGPSVQLPTAALPLTSVVCVAPVMVPPPLVTVNCTVAPSTGVSVASSTSTRGGMGTGVDLAAVCASPPAFCTSLGTCATSTVNAPDAAPEATVMEAAPLDRAVTMALSAARAVTATAAELVDQVSAAPVMGCPFWSITVAFTTRVAPMAFSEMVPGDTATVVATGGVLPPSLHPAASRVIAEQKRSLRMMGELPGRVNGGGACRRQARHTRSSQRWGARGRAGRRGARGGERPWRKTRLRGIGSGRVRRAWARGTRRAAG